MKISGPHPQKFWFRDYVGSEMCIFNKFAGDPDVAVPGATSWEPLPCTTVLLTLHQAQVPWDPTSVSGATDLPTYCEQWYWDVIKSPLKFKMEENFPFLPWLISPLGTLAHTSLSHWSRTLHPTRSLSNRRYLGEKFCSTEQLNNTILSARLPTIGKS